VDKRLAALLSKTYFGANVSEEFKGMCAADPTLLVEAKAELARTPNLTERRCYATAQQIKGLKALIDAASR
jgi:hypothetical protein